MVRAERPYVQFDVHVRLCIQGCTKDAREECVSSVYDADVVVFLPFLFEGVVLYSQSHGVIASVVASQPVGHLVCFVIPRALALAALMGYPCQGNDDSVRRPIPTCRLSDAEFRVIRDLQVFALCRPSCHVAYP